MADTAMAPVQETAPCGMIYKAIAGVMEDVGAVGKNGINKQQGFKFRSIDDVMNALHPAMTIHRVFTVPEILEQTRETKTFRNGTELVFSLCKIRYTFFAEDGSSVSAVVIGEGMDSGDKATNKAMAIAYKYACFQVFCIPTEEMVDPDSERPELEEEKKPTGQKKAASKPVAAGKKTEPAPVAKAKGKEEISEDSMISEAMLRTLQAEMEATGVKEKQLMQLFSIKSLDQMTVAQFKRAMKKFEITKEAMKAS